MSLRREEFSVDEWYHCYTRGVEKKKIFETVGDYRRYVQLLYLCNSTQVIHRSDIFKRVDDIFSMFRPDTLVDIGAYCLMPNHPHLLIKEKRPGGISKFMQKLGTAYTMYFNIKNNRTGSLFITPFRSKHVKNDAYLQRVVQYIHLNPAELKEFGWKRGSVKNMGALETFLEQYPYSSLAEHQEKNRPQKTIIAQEIFNLIHPMKFPLMLAEAREYYEEIAREDPIVKATP